MNRRSFLKSGVAAAGALAGAPFVRPNRADTPLRIALIGIGGRAFSHYHWLREEKVVALCDADTRQRHTVSGYYQSLDVRPASETFPSATFYQDYRELFESRDDFDAVVICTPDVHHYPIVMRTLRAGKAVFCEKPLAYSPWEAQRIAEETAKLKLPTQMGNQGMASIGWRQADAYLASDAIGEVTSTHSWIHPSTYDSSGWTLPNESEADPIPDGLAWDLWCGPAPKTHYIDERFHPALWRNWVDYGCGRLGDFGCHTMNAMFKTLQPGYPKRIEVITRSSFNGEAFPAQRVIKWTFPSNEQRQEFTTYWYDGGLMPPRPSALEADRALPHNGSLFIGTQGILHVLGSHNRAATLIPDAARRAHGKPELRVPEGRAHHLDFLDAAKGILPWNAPLSNFTYSGPMTATVLMPNFMLCNRISTLDIDPRNGTAKVPAGTTNPFTYTPRPGWYLEV